MDGFFDDPKEPTYELRKNEDKAFTSCVDRFAKQII